MTTRVIQTGGGGTEGTESIGTVCQKPNNAQTLKT